MGRRSRREILSELASRPERSALFADFDGTLSVVVGDPDSAVLVPGALEALVEVSEVLSHVVVVSGRPASFLASRVGAGPNGRIGLYGLHGVERWDGTKAVVAKAADAYRNRVAAAVAAAEQSGVEAMVVEDKTYSVTLHWRRAEASGVASTAGLATRLGRRLAAENGLVVVTGKKSIELVAPIGIDKGTVVSELGARSAVVAYLGDDVSDLPAFGALDSLEASGATVARVAVSSNEAPPGLLDRADLVLDGPLDAGGLIAELAALVRSS